MKKAFPFVLFFGAATLLFLPFPAYVYVVMPYAEGTNDPDAIEAVAWFGGVSDANGRCALSDRIRHLAICGSAKEVNESFQNLIQVSF